MELKLHLMNRKGVITIMQISCITDDVGIFKDSYTVAAFILKVGKASIRR